MIRVKSCAAPQLLHFQCIEGRRKNKSENRSEQSVIIFTTIESSRGNNITDIGQQTH